MKLFNQNILSGLLALTIFLSGCDALELDLANDPNNLTPDQADVDLFLNAIQENFVRHIEGDADFDANDNFSSGGATNGDGLALFGAQLTRQMTMRSARLYISVYQPSDSDDEWFNAYGGIITNTRLMNALAEEAGQLHHIAIGQVIEAYTISSMVDFYGDIPYTEAANEEGNFNPALDDAASVYAAAMGLLDAAIANFGQAAPAPANDIFYGGDTQKWINAANSLKIKLLNQTRLVDAGAASQIQTIIASGNYIQSSADDFQYRWPGTSAAQPDTRHPRYGVNYLPAGAGDYQSNWMMGHMDNTSDPRIRYYFYRQSAFVPGAEIDPNEETLACSLQSAPAHYISGGYTFCNLPNGYWGRDHANDEGTPPDGLLRTTFGVYPAGGLFDDYVTGDASGFTDKVAPGKGGNGAGITPIVTAAWIDLYQAEQALASGNSAGARTFLESALTKNIAKVQSFISVDAGADTSFEPSADDVAAWITGVGNAFDAADTNGKWDILGEQFIITVFGNGIESYNFYRRTGAPSTLQPNLDPNPGTFVRSFFYPANSVNRNDNVDQKPGVDQPVFWDNNPTGPAAN